MNLRKIMYRQPKKTRFAPTASFTAPETQSTTSVLSLLVLLSAFLGALFFFPAVQPSAPIEAPINTPENAVSERTITQTTPNTPDFAFDQTAFSANAIYVLDLKTGESVYAQNKDAAWPLASITKLMTALVASELLPPYKQVEISSAAISQLGDSHLAVGDRIATKDLVALMLVTSSNDAAYALAESAGSKIDPTNPINAFVSAMNTTATELDLSGTIFYGPTGLDISADQGGAYGSAADVSTLISALLDNTPHLLYETTHLSRTFHTADGRPLTATNTNPFIATIPGIKASKTGFTDLAGGNVTIAYDLGFNHPVAITVLGSSATARFTDMQTVISVLSEPYQSKE